MSELKRRQIGIVDVDFGDGVQLIEPVNLYGCSIGENSFIGPFVEIQKNSSVGAHCRVQSHSFICEMVHIGDHCFIGHGVMFINDTFAVGAPSPDISDWRETRIENRVSIGSNATILPVRVCSGSVIGAGAVVTKEIDVRGVYAGNPAKLVRKL